MRGVRPASAPEQLKTSQVIMILKVDMVDRLNRKVKKLKRQRTRSLIHGPDCGSADSPAHSCDPQR
jgi:hypothetical protein